MLALTSHLPVTGWQVGLAMIIAYFSPIIVALANRQNWSQALKFLCAVGFAAGAALAGVAVGTVTFAAFLTAFGPALAVQQAAWHLQLPIAGDPGLLDKLLTAGAPVTPESVDTSVPTPPPVPGEVSAPEAPLD